MVETIGKLPGLHGLLSWHMVLLAGIFTWRVAGICGAVAVVDTGGFNGC